MKSARQNLLVCCCGSVLLLTGHQVLGDELGSEAASNGKSLGEYLKGEPTESQLFLEMFTYHFNTKSRRIRNWNQELIGLQYKDFFACTFDNSFFNRTWAAGLTRNFSTAKLSDNWDMTLGYRLGLAYGYKEGEAPLSSVSPLIPIVEVYNQYVFHQHYGLELMLTTSISLGFFYQF